MGIKIVGGAGGTISKSETFTSEQDSNSSSLLDIKFIEVTGRGPRFLIILLLLTGLFHTAEKHFSSNWC